MDNDNTTAAPLLAPGSYLRDRWEIVKKIGGGGFGEIYRAKDHAHDPVSMFATLKKFFKENGQRIQQQILVQRFTIIIRKQNNYFQFPSCNPFYSTGGGQCPTVLPFQ